MANEHHLYLTADGDYSSGAASLANETWQTGVRLLLDFDNTPDDVGTFPTDWGPVADTISRTEANWTITGNWTAQGGIGSNFDPGDFLNDQAGPAFKTWIKTADCFSNGVRLRTLRLYPIGPDGRSVPAPPYAKGSPCTLTYTGTLPTGAVSTTLLPAQLSVAASLRTLQVGPRGRGRMFGPALGAGQVSAAVLSNTSQTALLAAYKLLLEDLFVAVNVPTAMSVAPCITGAPWTNYAIVKSVRIDNIIDTQRRRRRSAQGTTASATLAP